MKEILIEEWVSSSKLQILEAIYDVEKDNNQMFFDIWCEARLPNGQYI
jgi:hypothetical protein